MSAKFNTRTGGDLREKAESDRKFGNVSIPIGNGKNITLHANQKTFPLEVCYLEFTEHAEGKNVHEKCTFTDSNKPQPDITIKDSPKLYVSKTEALQGLVKASTYLEENPNLEKKYLDFIWDIYEHICTEDINENAKINQANERTTVLDQPNSASHEDLATTAENEMDNIDILDSLTALHETDSPSKTTQLVETESKDDLTEFVETLMNNFEQNTAEVSHSYSPETQTSKTVKFKMRLGNDACEVCGKSFHSRRKYNDHMKFHSGENPYVCKVCNKGFGGRGSLVSHMIRHRNDSYVCEKCGKSFKHPSDLKTHSYSHAHVKRHVCPICGYRSALKCQYINHMITHTKEKPYICSVCGTRFTRSGSLKRHNKVKHHKLL